MKNIFVFIAIGIIIVLSLGSIKPNLNLGEVKPKYGFVQCLNKTTDYRIIRAVDLDTLQKNVKDQLGYGFSPIGEISLFNKEYCQVMVAIE